jgi:ubiquinone/menaquinone biosynthesis C-methylase UbiE
MDTIATNHHAHQTSFSGPRAYLFALAMARHRRHRAGLAVRVAGVGPGDVLVDIGSGPGGAARAAAKAGATVIGVEPSTEFRRVARLLTRSRRVRYVPGSAEHAPVEDGRATIVWALASVHHWHDVEAGLREVRRILRVDGRFLAIERQSHHGATGLATHGWTDEQTAAFVDQCRAAGFADVTVEHHDDGHDVWIAIVAR